MSEFGEGTEILDRWTHDDTGKECVVGVVDRYNLFTETRERAHYVGYTQLDPDADDPPRNVVHGGLTYAGPDGWVGFDTGHAFDICVDDDGNPLPANMEAQHTPMDSDWATVWSLDDVKDEAERMAANLAEYELDQ